MSGKAIHIANSKILDTEKKVVGKVVLFENENYYKISNVDEMRPFFMSIVSHSNHWMFISSNGGLTAGRKNSESALFPYYTDDKITESAEITGSKTIFQIHSDSQTILWEPFSERYSQFNSVKRNLYKNSYGNKIVFEEINEDLNLIFRYHWNSSEKYGFIKKSTLINNSSKEISITLLDGIQNILPYGVESALQNSRSNLVDAYKRNELDPSSGIGVYALSAIIVDKAEPSEALKATTVWSTGIPTTKYLLSSLQIDAFRNGKDIQQEEDIKGEKGGYFIHSKLTLAPEEHKNWLIIAEVNQSRIQISEVIASIEKDKQLLQTILQDVDEGTKQLVILNNTADAKQLTADRMRDARHFSNTLFNIMRGGIFDHNYSIEKEDFLNYLEKANRDISSKYNKVLEKLLKEVPADQLKELANTINDSDLKRLVFEYMPLKFSRRHGDPSRPWNKFSINTTTKNGEKILDYQGNWRDIFQNWEALAYSYPAFIENMIFKFVNASTFEGYNPYRVTKDGFDWEVIEPDDPWSYIGYWGDHQIIYLLKFLEFIEKHYPNKLAPYFNQNIFVFANVPYKIKEYSEILKNPKDTIVFDEALDSKIRSERQIIGADATLLKNKNNSIHKVNLLEKLLVTTLAKLSNFVPEGGIWMNTQRPEWNDANNALVGNGVSMVTLYYLRRFLKFFENRIDTIEDENYLISEELLLFFNDIRSTFINNFKVLSSKISDKDRKKIIDSLGLAGSNYRTSIYQNGHSGNKKRITKEDLLQFTEITLRYIDQSIKVNKRTDNLYHSYNLITVQKNEVSLSYLSEMLEGQVALLSSEYLNGEASLELLNALKNSALFRPDQYSYILYPNKELPGFYKKNNIPSKNITASKLLQELLKNKNRQIIEKDSKGTYHFNGAFNNAESLKSELKKLPKTYEALIRKETSLLLDIFEETFDHKSFTGRSGTFFGYEGLGSIYWHMVSKLLLSVQETALEAISNNEAPKTIGGLLDHYYEINEGIGVHKSPELYGAIPTDPYSHTPAGKGAQQPGMTGQVKEDILTRFGELGVYVEKGKLKFNPCLLRKEEFLKSAETFSYQDIKGETQQINLKERSLCFTYCQTPIVYQLSKEKALKVSLKNGSIVTHHNLELDIETSTMIFNRTGDITQITVFINE